MVKNKVLSRILKSDRLFPAYLFVSPIVSMAFEDAMAFTSDVLLGGLDGDTLDYRRSLIAKDQHPDLLVFNKDTYVLDDLECLPTFFDYIPTYENPKFLIINNADKLTPVIQNQFLKTLEEPYADMVIILIARDLVNILSTIQSRCVSINFNRPSFNPSDYPSINEADARIFYNTFNSFSFCDSADELEYIRSMLLFFYKLTATQDANYILSLPFNDDGETLKSFLDKYPFVPLMRALRSFFMDKLLLLMGEPLRYNLDKYDDIHNTKISLSSVNKILSKLKDSTRREGSKFNHMWLRGVLLDVC